MKGNQYFLIIISVLMVGIISLSLTYPDLDTKLLPIIFGSLVLVLCLIQLTKDLYGKEKTEKNLQRKPEMQRNAKNIGLRPYVDTVVWIVGLILIIYMVGFMVATPLYLISFIKFHHRSWVSALITASVSTAFLYLVFVVALRVNLYSGLFFR